MLAILVVIPIGLAQEESDVSCTDGVYTCPDGTDVSRVPPNCEFSTCAGETLCTSTEDCLTGQHCSVKDGDCLSRGALTVCYGYCVVDEGCTTEQDCIDSGKCSAGLECTCSDNKCYTGLIAEPPTEEPTTEEPEGAGIEPDSPFYVLDLLLEKIQLDLAGEGVYKAKLHLKFAGERLAEAEKMNLKNKEKHREEAMEKYEEGMDAAVEAVDKAQGIGQDVSEIVKEINVSTARHIAVLELVMAKVPEQAKISIERNINKSKERIQTMQDKKSKIKEKENNKGITIKSDVTVGKAVVDRIAEGYEELNPAFPVSGKAVKEKNGTS